MADEGKSKPMSRFEMDLDVMEMLCGMPPVVGFSELGDASSPRKGCLSKISKFNSHVTSRGTPIGIDPSGQWSNTSIALNSTDTVIIPINAHVLTPPCYSYYIQYIIAQVRSILQFEGLYPRVESTVVPRAGNVVNGTGLRTPYVACLI